MMHSTEKLNEVQGLLVLMASLSHGLEKVLGRGAAPITFRAGKTLGMKADTAGSESEIEAALNQLKQELSSAGIEWPFELWKAEADRELFYSKDGKKAVKLVFRHCMVRCSLFRYGHEQKLSLCMMNHGLFCGYLQKILGKRADLEIIHAGENACLKELVITE